MACTPHTGAASASLLPMTNPIVELLPTHDWYRDGHATAFYQARNNATLKNLNLTPMPQEVEYHLLYGTGVSGQAPTPANYTAGPVPWFNTNVGDGGALGTPFGVLKFSALGYEVINLNNAGGDSMIGTRIHAFNPAWGGKAPKSERGLPLAHSRFLGNAVDVIHGLLAAP